MAATRTQRPTSFGAVAESYDRFRPAPPPEAAAWLLPEGARRVADLGAGTGGFSRVLAERVDQVVAVELDLRMATVLRDRSAGVAAAKVTVVNARGEALPLGAAQIRHLVAVAHRQCYIANSLKTEVLVEPTIQVVSGHDEFGSAVSS